MFRKAGVEGPGHSGISAAWHYNSYCEKGFRRIKGYDQNHPPDLDPRKETGKCGVGRCMEEGKTNGSHRTFY
jgi:hypothetical protein